MKWRNTRDRVWTAGRCLHCHRMYVGRFNSKTQLREFQGECTNPACKRLRKMKHGETEKARRYMAG